MERMSRMPGRSIKYFGWAIQRHQLWMAEDYLLFREISGTHEEVRRYYYKDIQAIVMGPTSAWRSCNWIVGMLLVFLVACGAGAAAVGSTGALVLALLAGVIPMGILSGNLILGPTCKTTLYTAAAEAQLYSLGRQRSAAKAIQRLLPFVEAAQRSGRSDTEPTPPVQPSATPFGPAETSGQSTPAAAPFGVTPAESEPIETTPPPGPDPSNP